MMRVAKRCGLRGTGCEVASTTPRLQRGVSCYAFLMHDNTKMGCKPKTNSPSFQTRGNGGLTHINLTFQLLQQNLI